MKQTPESQKNGLKGAQEKYIPGTENTKKLGHIAIEICQTVPDSGENREKEEHHIGAIGFVHDHFPEDVLRGEHFKQTNESDSLETEEDYEKIFSMFKQEELVPFYNRIENTYRFDPYFRPFKETAEVYLHKTEAMVKNLSGEDGKNPPTDVAVYLDKSARPVSWFVNDFWNDFSSKPMPRTEHLAIDRKTWFSKMDVELSSGEYIKETGELAGWEDIPIHDVRVDDIIKMQSLLKAKIITIEDIKKIKSGGYNENQIKDRMYKAFLSENSEDYAKYVKKEISWSDLLNSEEFEKLHKEALEQMDQLPDRSKILHVWEAFQIASQIRALFLPGGITEEEMSRPDMIMRRESGMKGKNITIIDEVERTGVTGKIATNFISWAFPEAASVRFDIFYEAKKLSANGHKQNNQMLMIPFWYSLDHDDGSGRGINDINTERYREKYEKTPDNITRAALYGADFLGYPMIYDMEVGKKSLHLREQIARLHIEYNKGNIR